MDTCLLRTLFAQAMLGVALVLPVLFAVGFCAAYGLLFLLNAGFARFRKLPRQPAPQLFSFRAMVVAALGLALLVCCWLLAGIDGRYT